MSGSSHAPAPAPGSSPSPASSARRTSSSAASASSVGRSSVEVSSTGTASVSPGSTSATRSAALTRQASNAKKRISVGGGGGVKAANTSGGAGISGSSSSTTTTREHGQGGPRRSMTGNRSDNTVNTSSRMSTSTSNEGSLSNIIDGDDPSVLLESAYADGTPEELSRLTRDQLVSLVVRERQSKEEMQGKLSDMSVELATTAQTASDALKLSKDQDSKIQEAYASSERLERELAEHIEALAKAEAIAQSAEIGGREAQKRFREQVESFEMDRTKWLETEQALQTQIAKLRSEYQSLQAKKEDTTSSLDAMHPTEASEGDQWLSQPVQSPAPSHLSTASPTFQIPLGTLEELQSLHAKVADLNAEQLTTSVEVQRLQNELEELSRLNGDLQEQNENYEVLLSERMLAGLANFADSGIGSSTNTSSMQDSSLSDGGIGSRPSSSFGALAEHPSEGDASDRELDEPDYFETSGDGHLATGAVPVQVTPNRIGRTAKKRQSMMGMGGGFDLEAELDRAQREEEEQRLKDEEANKKKARAAAAARRRANQTSTTVGHDGEAIPGDVDGLRKEVKLLRQENKGLSTYVSKILERIIGIEGFEKVLAVEREGKPTPDANFHSVTTPPPPPPAKTTAASLGVAPISRPPPPPLPLRAVSSTISNAGLGPVSPGVHDSGQAEVSNKKKNRFSMDWIASTIFKGGNAESQANTTSGIASGSVTGPGLKPMMLTGGPAVKQPVAEEDEDDRRARARLQSEMRLLGIDAHTSPGMQGGSPGSVRIGANRSPSKRISSGSASPQPPTVPPKEDDITAREKEMHHELDNGRASGFTELPAGSPNDSVKIRGHRKKPSGTYSGPTLNLAGGVGLGVSYSKDSATSPSWGTRTPSVGASSNPSEPDDKRSSAASGQSA